MHLASEALSCFRPNFTVIWLDTQLSCLLAVPVPCVGKFESRREQCKTKMGWGSSCLSQLLVTQLCWMPVV